MFDTFDGPAPGFRLKEVYGHVERLVPGVCEVLIMSPYLIGVTAVEPCLASGFANISGFCEGFQEMPFLTCTGCGFSHAFHPKKKRPAGCSHKAPTLE